MMKGDDVAVVIPAYNAARTIRGAIDSALNQTAAPATVVVVDDGSTDRTRRIIAEYGPRVRYLYQANAGPAAARNLGARIGARPLVALLDADDSWLPNRIESQLASMSDPRAAVVATWREQPRDRKAGAESVSTVTFDMLWQQNRFVTSSALIRRSALEAVGGFDEARELISVEDYNLWLRMAAAGWRLIGRPERVCEYLPAEGSLSSQSERMAAAELANLESLRRRLRLAPHVANAKRIAIHEQYARELIYFRNLRAARRLLAVPMRHAPSLTRIAWWMATFAPVGVLNLRRQVAAAAE